MDDFYFKVLSRLYEYGINEETEINDIFVNVKHRPSYSKERQIEDIIANIKHNKHINSHNEYFGGNDTPIIKASITINGYDYYRKHLLEAKTIQSLINQKSVNRKTWGLTALSMLLTFGVAIWASTQNKDLEQRIFQLEQSQRKNITSCPKPYPTHKIVDIIYQKK